MSRTFRRKHYEAETGGSWVAKGCKTAGFYTEREFHYFRGGFWNTYLVPTKQQYYREYWRNHGESKTNKTWSPSHSYREYRMSQNRSITKQELYKFFNDPTYEPMVEADPRNCWWDWD